MLQKIQLRICRTIWKGCTGFNKQAATGQKYLYASENPAVAADGMTLRSNLKSIETFTNTINSTKQWMESTDFALQKIVNILNDAQGIVLQGLDDSYDAEERRVMGH